MNERFVDKMRDPQVRHDVTVLADFVSIWCDAHHKDAERRPAATDAAGLDVYGKRRPTLCEECEAHLAYAEKRRAFCPKDPKPFCAHCDTHCYRDDERTWQATMMRFSGPKSWKRGYAIDGIKHALEERKWRRDMARKAAQAPAGAE